MSSSYWRKREQDWKNSNKKSEEECIKEIQKIYLNELDLISKEIESFFSRYASKEKITMAEAKKKARKIDIEEYKRKAEKYVEEKDFSDQANEEMRLYNLTMKVNRLELLKANIGLELVNGTNDLETYFGEKLDAEVMAELERNAAILGPSVLNNAKSALVAVNSSFQNATWSDRVWNSQSLLKNNLTNIISNALIQGKNARDFIPDIRKQFDVSRYQAERLLRTELTRARIQAQAESYKAENIEDYEYVACGLPDCCKVCKALDGKTFKVKDMEHGENAPPMHPNCHCATAPYLDREEFDEWLNGYSEHGLTFEEWKNRKDVTLYKLSEAKKSIKIKSENDLYKISKSSIINMESIEEIKNYFKTEYNIKVDGFDKKDLFQVKTTLAGVDDFLALFPKAKHSIYQILYVPQMTDYGKMSSDGKMKIGKGGLQSYGTGVHEAAHALDFQSSSFDTYDFSEGVVDEARKKCGYRKNGKAYRKMLFDIIGNFTDVSKPNEIFAYSIESEIGNNSNEFTKAVLECTIRRIYAETN